MKYTGWNMRSFFCGYFAFIFLLTQPGCKSKEDNQTDVIEEQDTQVKTSIKDYSNKMQLLVQSDSGVIRNVFMGMPASKVRGLEDSASIMENGDNYIDYAVHLDSLEEAEVLYYLDEEDKVNKIEVDIYPADETSRSSLYKEFIAYFNSRYGEPTSEIEEVKIWNLPDKNLIIEMRMLGNAKIHDLQIDFKPAVQEGEIQ